MCMCSKTKPNLSPCIAFILNNSIFKVLRIITDLQSLRYVKNNLKSQSHQILHSAVSPLAKDELMQTHAGLVTWPSKFPSIAKSYISRNRTYANLCIHTLD